MRSVRPATVLLAAGLLLAVLALVSCGGDGDDEGDATDTGAATAPPGEQTTPEAGRNAPAPSGEPVRSQTVEIVDFAYDPDPVTIQEGGKVIWKNRDPVGHTATADDGSFDTGVLEEGKLKAETFKEPGEYAYHCEIHPQMQGTVEVVARG